MGMTVSTLGYVNADGWTDFLGGAPLADHAVGGVDVGWGRAVLGNAWPPVAYCTAKTNSAKCVPVITYTGCPSVSIAGFHLVAFNVLESKPGMLIWSRKPKAAPFHGGTLCVKAPIVRTPVQVSSTFAQPLPCQGLYDFTFDHAYMASKGITAGEDVYAQYWSRDRGFLPPDAIGLTNGLHVTILP